MQKLLTDPSRKPTASGKFDGGLFEAFCQMIISCQNCAATMMPENPEKALMLYEMAFELVEIFPYKIPEHFTTCLHLIGLRSDKGNLSGARNAMATAQFMAISDEQLGVLRDMIVTTIKKHPGLSLQPRL